MFLNLQAHKLHENSHKLSKKSATKAINAKKIIKQ